MNCIKKQLMECTVWKFCIVGLMNTVLGTVIMFVFYNVFHINYWISSASNYFFGSCLSYVLNRLFTFNNKKSTRETLPRFILNIILCYVLAYGVAKPLVTYMLVETQLGTQENVAMIVGMFIFVVLNYAGQRFFVFKNK